tara:strand:- start:48 stop:953 length:906 start_codon:yes stop_codon:yes gene_type:complete
MANTLGGINLAQIAQQTLETLSAEMPIVSAFTTDFSSDVADVGESVSTRVATAVSAGDATSGYSSSDVTSTAKTITLNKHKHFTAKFTDLEIAKGGLDMLERTFVRPAVHAVVNTMMDDLLALVTDTNFADEVDVAAASFGADDVADLAGDLTTKNVPKADRALIIKPTYFANLAQDNAIQASYAYGNPSAIRDNVVPKVHGFNVYEYSDIPANAYNIGSPAVSHSLQGFACGPEALLIAGRQPALPENWAGAVESVQEPGTGVTLQLRNWYEGKDGAQYITATMIYGVATGTDSLKKIVV